MGEMAPQAMEGLARSAYDAINRGDLDAFIAAVHPDVEFHVLTAEAEGGVFRGHEGVREWWDQVKGTFSGWHFEVERVVPMGDRGYAQLVVTGTLEGVHVPQRMWQAWFVRDELPVWWKSFRTESEALAVLQGERPVA